MAGAWRRVRALSARPRAHKATPALRLPAVATTASNTIQDLTPLETYGPRLSKNVRRWQKKLQKVLAMSDSCRNFAAVNLKTKLMTTMIDGTTTVRYYVEKEPGYKYSVAMATFDKDGKETNPREIIGGPMTAWELLEWYDSAKQAWKECHDIDDVLMYI